MRKLFLLFCIALLNGIALLICFYIAFVMMLSLAMRGNMPSPFEIAIIFLVGILMTSFIISLSLRASSVLWPFYISHKQVVFWNSFVRIFISVLIHVSSIIPWYLVLTFLLDYNRWYMPMISRYLNDFALQLIPLALCIFFMNALAKRVDTKLFVSE